MQDVQYQINQGYHLLRKSEQKVADYFLKETYDVEEMTLQKLEDIIGVAQPTIVRFIKAIGYPSFRQFKYVLIANQKTSSFSMKQDTIPQEAWSIEELSFQMTKRAQHQIAAIWKFFTFEMFEKAAKLMHDANTIVIFGSDDTYSMQYEWAIRLSGLHKRVVFREQEALQKLEASHMRKGDVACIFESSQKAYDQKIKALIHAQGASDVVISMYALDKYADVAIFQPLKQRTVEGLDGAVLTLLDLLVEGIKHCETKT